MKWKRWRENNKPEALSIQQKLSNIWKQRQMVQKFPEKFPEIAETVEIRNAILSIENSRNFGSKVEWKENFGGKNLGIPREVAPFSGNSGKCCSTRHRKLPKIQTGSFS